MAHEKQPTITRILLVENNEIVREILCEQLKEEFGCEVTVATNGMRALETVQADPFSLVVSNVRMPGLDGIELLRRMRAYDGTARTPFLMVTTDPLPMVQRQLEEISTEHDGTLELIGKTALDPLLNAVERLLGHSSQRSEAR